jgi:Domain of unknown function (DUF4190)
MVPAMSLPPPPSDQPGDQTGPRPGGTPPPPPAALAPPPYARISPPTGPWGGAPVYAPVGMSPPSARYSGMAIAGFVLSLVALLPCFWIWIQVPGVLGVIFSAVGLRAIKQHQRRGRGLAIAGLVVGIIAIAIAALFTLYLYTSDDCDTTDFQFECNFD